MREKGKYVSLLVFAVLLTGLVFSSSLDEFPDSFVEEGVSDFKIVVGERQMFLMLWELWI